MMAFEQANSNSEDIAGYAKSGEVMSSIFEEIEQLLQNNKGLEISSNAKQVEVNEVTHPTDLNDVEDTAHQTAVLNSYAESENATLNFLSTCGNHGFLISADTQTLPEEELSLFSVNQNELQPVNAPFMVPGIYKKIANSPVATTETIPQYAAKEGTNVFFATKTSKGKIVSRTDFENCSIAEDSYEHHSNTAEIFNSIEAKPESTINLASNILLKFASHIYKSARNDRIVIDRKKNEIVRTRAVSNQKVVYRLLGPEELSLKTNSVPNFMPASRENKQSPKVKKGRPRKNAPNDSENPLPQSSSKKLKLANGDSFQQPSLRTRSGRVVKLVKPQLNCTKIIENPVVQTEQVESLVNDAKDKDFYCSFQSITLPTKSDDFSTPPISSSPTQKRRVPPESICPKCGKIFLGRRLQRHFTQHPDHMLAQRTEDSTVQEPKRQTGIASPTEDMTLFRFLISKLQKPLLNEDQRADLFLNELNDLIEQLQLRCTRLIRNTSGLHFVSARTARVLGIPEGQYALDMSAIDTEMPLLDTEQNCVNGEELKRHQITPPVVTVNTPSLDYTAISLDDTLTDEAAQKLNLSAGGKLLPPSEESLLRAVDDLVHDGITKLVDANLLHPPRTVVQSSGTSTLVPHYDHVSDNAVEALTIKENNAMQGGTPILDLSVDFFQFKNN
ncbi:uncharacterized protein LOC118733100 [Rhagoletis pomonella]|uniref:uncharacterized protein LOC118733100 n=1 Tax=Rhagoletis pomonella TaxID=28610 RepID=UPI0017814E18|nr:uncharacterized protein LOC118733100 [Rhagoletis pomonella]